MLKATQLPPQAWRTEWIEQGLWQEGALDSALSASARRRPDKIAVVDAERTVTYGELDRLVDRCVSFLTQQAIGPGDRVAWQLPNCIEAAVLFFALSRLRAVSVPIVAIFRHREVAFICEQTAARMLVVPKRYHKFDYVAMADGLRDQLAEMATVHAIDLTASPEENWPAGVASETVSLDDRGAPAFDEIAAVLYTSGTESDPKGALHSHTGLSYDARSMAEFLDLSSDDVFFMPSPLTHVTGLLNGIVSPITLGATVVLQRDWHAEVGLRLIEQHEVTYSVVATPFLQQMFALPDADRALRSVRHFRCGGADIPESLMDAADRLGVSILRVYGMTEMPTVSCVPPDASRAQKQSTDGKVLPHTIVRLSEDKRTVDGVEVGEVECAGPEIFLGYLKQELNQGAFTADGLVRTGDLATIDPDAFVRISGRSKDIIIRGGENLSAREIEDALLRSPHIEDAAVVGVPDSVFGERACAFIVGSDAARLDLDALRELVLDAGLAIQKSPEYVRVLDEMPRTSSGKVIKTALRAQFVASRGT